MSGTLKTQGGDMMQESDSNSGAANIRAHEDATEEEVYLSYTEDQQTELDQMKANAQIYRDLTKSISPQVFGHDDVKRAVLLMLFGGIPKKTKEVINRSLHVDKDDNLE